MGCHQLHKLLKTDLTTLIDIEVGHSHINKTSRRIKSTILFDGFSEVQWSKHIIMIIIKVIENLLEHFYIFLVAFSSDEF
jgi:hypothetical protein